MPTHIMSCTSIKLIGAQRSVCLKVIVVTYTPVPRTAWSPKKRLKVMSMTAKVELLSLTRKKRQNVSTIIFERIGLVSLLFHVTQCRDFAKNQPEVELKNE